MTKDSLLQDIVDCVKCRKDEASISLCWKHSIEWSYFKLYVETYNMKKSEPLKGCMGHG